MGASRCRKWSREASVGAEGTRGEFEAIVAEAARSIAAPVAFLTLLDPEGEKVLAIRGWNVARMPVGCGFASAISGEKDVVVVADTTADRRFASHPFVTGQPHIRFFAGAPIMESGRFVGALVVVDRVAHRLAADQVTSLRLLARQASRELDVRREISEIEQRFREFFEQTDDLVMSIGSRGSLVHFNEAVPNTLGVQRDELLRQPLETFLDEDARDDFRATLAEVFEVGQPRSLETVFATSSGRRLSVEGSIRPRVIDGTTVMARVIFRDISERKQFEAELGNARDAALEAARLKSQFLTNVSHEIRTPMNGIIGMLDLLQASKLDTEQRDYAVQAKESADQLLTIVNNILYVSNVEAAGLGAASIDFDLYRTLHRIVEVIKVAALGKDLEVSLEYQEGLPTVLRGQQSKLRQIVTNLLDNAVKFTESGSIRLKVAQQTETETHRVIRFEVRDSGIGISSEDRLLLFEKFSQVEGQSTRRYQGAGLGLATARHLVEMLGGLIDVDSNPGAGSTFWFTIPFPKQALGRNPIASSDLDFKGKRVLLIDRTPTSHKIIRHYLESAWEMRVDAAGSAAEALALLQSVAATDPVRVVIYEALPGIDAVAFAGQIRSDERFRSTNLVYLAGTTEVINRATMREAGISASVAKPVGQGEMFDALAVALAQDAIQLARPAQPVAAPAPVVVSAAQRKSIRVLLAEDNFLNAKLTMQLLQKLGYEADSVPNGEEAIEAVATDAYHVILMDCQMPVCDGYQATIEIRRREREHGIAPRRIIAMTANALAGDREKCLAAGMDDYLSKPTRSDDLDKALARYFAVSAPASLS